MIADSNSPYDIQALGAELMQRGRAAGLGKRSLKVLTQLVDNPGWAAMSSITQIAEATAVSPSTVTRVATKLGYSGFNQLQDLFRQTMSKPSGFYTSSARALLPKDNDENSDGRTAFDTAVEVEIGNIVAFYDAINPDKLRASAALLAKSRRVRVLGLRQCFSLAHFAAYTLHLLRDGVATLGTAGHTLFEDVSDLGPEDVAVLISFKPYTREVVEASRALRANGVSVILLTDSLEAPFPADHVFSVATQGPFFFNAMAAAMVSLETLLIVTAETIGEDAVKRLHRMEDLFETMNVEA